MKIKNVMLGIVGGLFALTVATISCKKDSPTTKPTATVTGITPPSGPVGTVVTISGTNLTGASVKFGTTSATPTSVTATSIVVAVPAGLSAGAVTVTVTVGSTSPTTTFTVTTVAPSPTSDSVATANLIAHWTFDGDSKEKGSGVAASTAVGADFSQAGKIGNCATFTNGYLLYAPITTLNQDTALESYSISMWVNIPAANANPLRSLFQITGNRFPDIWGQVGFELVNNGVVGDTLPLQARQVQVDGTAPYVHNQSTGANYGNSTNKWTFITQTYDGNLTNQTMKIYANGTLIDSTQLTTVDKSVSSTQTTFRLIPTGGSPTPTPTAKVYIGTLAFKDRGNDGGDGYGNFAPTYDATAYPWASESLTGKIDDIRVFNRPLTLAEVLELYALGTAGK